MEDGAPTKMKIVTDHFKSPMIPEKTYIYSPSSSSQHRSNSESLSRGKLKRAIHMLNRCTLRGLPWLSNPNCQEKVELNAAELESLRSELADFEDKETYLKAQLEHVDEVLRSARLSGYLKIRKRWTALPSEPPPIDDSDIDDWLPRFVVLQDVCVFFYLVSTDLKAQDSALLSDITEVGSLPCYKRDGEETYYCFYILTHQGLRFECASESKTQVESWLSELQTCCRLGSEAKLANGLTELQGSQLDNHLTEL